MKSALLQITHGETAMLKNSIAHANPAQKKAAIADGMLQLGENCTVQTLKVLVGCTDSDLALYGDDARAAAMAKSVTSTVVRVPVNQAA